MASYLSLGRIEIHDGHDADAAEALRQALALIDELDYREMRGHWLLAGAELAARRGSALQAARLLGAAEAHFERLGISHWHVDDAHVRDTVTAAAGAELGRDGFMAARAQGRELTDLQALLPTAR